MVDAFNAQNDRFYVTNNDRISFDTDRISIELLTGSAIIYNSINITFPSFIQGQAYYRNQTGGQVGGATSCETWATLLWQEWGPDESYHDERYFPAAPQNSIPGPTTRNLPRIYLGSVPSETTYINVQAALTRTTSPPLFYSLDPVAVPFPQGVSMNLPGGSLTCELFGVYASRHFDIRRYGNDIYLDRYMSIRNADTTLTPGNSPPANISTNMSGWNNLYYNSQTYPTSGVAPTMKSNYYLNYLMERKPYSTNGNKRPGGTNPCLQNSWQDLTSIFSGSLIITPGRHRA